MKYHLKHLKGLKLSLPNVQLTVIEQLQKNCSFPVTCSTFIQCCQSISVMPAYIHWRLLSVLKLHGKSPYSVTDL